MIASRALRSTFHQKLPFTSPFQKDLLSGILRYLAAKNWLRDFSAETETSVK